MFGQSATNIHSNPAETSRKTEFETLNIFTRVQFHIVETLSL